MRVAIDVASDCIRSPLGRDVIIEVALATLRDERVRDALISITLVERRAMARLNRMHLGHAGPTDVISFGFTRATPADPVIGDIYICPDMASAHAKARKTPVREEIVRLVAHGVLHVLGHDHPEHDRERSEMWRRQERVVARFRRQRAKAVRA